MRRLRSPDKSWTRWTRPIAKGSRTAISSQTTFWSASGTYENYIRPFKPEAPAGTGGKWLVSKGGGIEPIWGPDGKELFYLNLSSNQVMAVDIDTSKEFQAGAPRRLFTAPLQLLTTGWDWDLSPDGKRFQFVAPPNTGRTIPFTVVLNWQAGLKK
jgi:hypothetical protein